MGYILIQNFRRKKSTVKSRKQLIATILNIFSEIMWLPFDKKHKTLILGEVSLFFNFTAASKFLFNKNRLHHFLPL